MAAKPIDSPTWDGQDDSEDKGMSPAKHLDEVAILSPPVVSRWLAIRTDLLLMPLLTLIFGMQYWDKAILGSATLFGILKDLDLTSKRYSQASACFYYGYLIGALPMSIIAQRFKDRLNIFLGISVMLWGVMVMLTCVVTDWRGLYAQRICLGFVESSVSPAFVAITRMWYTKAEQPLRLGIWWSATGLFSIASGLTNHALGKTHTSLADWKLMFLVPGTVTIVLGCVLLLLLPPTPLRLPLVPIPGYNRLSEEQRQTIDAKVRANLTGNERHGLPWNWAQAREALRDPQIYIIFLMATSIYVSNGAVTVFGPLLVKSIGYTSTHATLLLTPGGASTAIGLYIICFLAARPWVARTPFARTTLSVISCWPVIAGCAMCWRGDWHHKAVPLIGYYLICLFGNPFVLMMGSATANMAGGTKQAIASAAIFLGYNCGNIASSYILIPKEAKDHYPTTFQIVIGCMCATMLLAILQGTLYFLENRRRDRLTGPSTVTEVVEQVDAHHDVNGLQELTDVKGQFQHELDVALEEDLTDRQNKQFRYTF